MFRSTRIFSECNRPPSTLHTLRLNRQGDRKYSLRLLIFGLTCLITCPTFAQEQASLLPGERNTIAVFRAANMGVVHINAAVTVSGPFEKHIQEDSTGTGFVLDKEGRILTAFHVVKDKDEIVVVLSDQSKHTARLVGTAPQLDIALLQIDVPEVNLVPLTLGRSSSLQVGQSVLAIGNPLGLHNSLSVGVISALQRTLNGSAVELSDAFIQTDAAINPGNSGGPLLNSSGQVIGINDANVPEAQGLGFAIPIDLAIAVVPDLIEMGHPYRPMLGVSGNGITPEFAMLFGLPVQQGFLVEEVLPDSPAAAAGLRAGQRIVVVGEKTHTIGGDIIVGINDEHVTSAADVAKAFLNSRPGQELRVTVYRLGKTITMTIPLQKMKMQF
jgi:S1-C subfamily serine protease